MTQRRILVDTADSTGWTTDGVVLTEQQIGNIVRAVASGEIVLVPTDKQNVSEVTYR